MRNPRHTLGLRHLTGLTRIQATDGVQVEAQRESDLPT
jgi:hypothetical protein